MSYQITISREFCASHQLRLPGGGLEPLHGHNWRLRVTVAAAGLDAIGCVMDFHRLEQIVDDIIRPLATVHLNDTAMFAVANPSAENVAGEIGRAVAGQLPAGVRLTRAQVSEAPGCVAAYLPDANPPEA